MKCVSDNPFLNCSGGIPSLLEEALQHDQDYGYGGIGIRVGTRSLLAGARSLARCVHSAMRQSARARRCRRDRKSTRLNSSHLVISYAVFCLKKKRSSSQLAFALNL